jgi:hypothetical protein
VPPTHLPGMPEWQSTNQPVRVEARSDVRYEAAREERRRRVPQLMYACVVPAAPRPQVLVRDLDPLPLSDRADEQVRRICVFLHVVNLPVAQTRALLAGYTPEIHADGVFRLRLLSGYFSFAEWRERQALRPHRDPDLPELVSALDHFRATWQPRALALLDRVTGEDDRAELEFYLADVADCPSRALRAKEWASRVEHLPTVPLSCYQAIWGALAEQGIEDELQQFKSTLEVVQDFIRDAPLDADELADMHEQRERAREAVEEWLDHRREQLAEHVDDETQTLLGLGELVPPPLPDVPLELFARFGSGARA